MKLKTKTPAIKVENVKRPPLQYQNRAPASAGWKYEIYSTYLT